MTARQRNYAVAAVVVVLLVALEVGLNLTRGPEGLVEFENVGNEPIENLVVTWRGSRWPLGTIPPGAMSRLVIGGRGEGTLALRFQQKGNPLGAYELPGFNSSKLAAEGFKQVLRIRANEVERFQDDGNVPTMGAWFGQRLWNGLVGETPDETQPQ